MILNSGNTHYSNIICLKILLRKKEKNIPYAFKFQKKNKVKNKLLMNF